jgi:hypothetical protein
MFKEADTADGSQHFNGKKIIIFSFKKAMASSI